MLWRMSSYDDQVISIFFNDTSLTGETVGNWFWVTIENADLNIKAQETQYGPVALYSDRDLGQHWLR